MNRDFMLNQFKMMHFITKEIRRHIANNVDFNSNEARGYGWIQADINIIEDMCETSYKILEKVTKKENND